MTPEFREFGKIYRLRREVIITEKLDGTNASVFVPDDASEPLAFGSRNRWITPEADNFGFARWGTEHEAELRELGPGTHYGEWWGAGIQRRYGLAEKRFSLFNTSRWGEARPACCHVVPVLAKLMTIDDEVIGQLLGGLRDGGSHAAPTFMKPEGLVIFHTASNALFKVTLDGDGHKGVKVAP